MRRRTSFMIVGGCAALAFALSAGVGRADDEPLVKDVDGKPAVAKKDIHGYLVWHKEKGWRVVCGSTGRHHMKGRIWLTGKGHFKHVKQWKDQDELISEMENEDSFYKSVKYRPDEREPNELSFDVVSQENHTSGIDFEIAPNPGHEARECGHIVFELGLGGPGEKDPVALDKKFVKIGAGAVHPPAVPFQTFGRLLAEEGEGAAPPPPPPVEKVGEKCVTGVSGRPADLGKGEFVGYDIWHSKNTQNWHLLVTTMEKRHHFKGRIWIDNNGPGKDNTYIEHIDNWKDDDEARSELVHDDWFMKSIKRRPNDEKPTEVTFDIVSQGGHASGINFKVHGGGMLEWELGVGGAKDSDPIEIAPKFVRIGPKAKHPAMNAFNTFANPDLHGN